ncbi:hypothetical protein RN001_008630 [Aquatica leii]|uniref:Uncharacterized protein n=1 Tax=Aquatica leii TaxID=1421715 RepID=A0AAN7SHC2_9COLE|nr:hypothetical protein RN001_008630 [Aquatica leii]
MLHKHKISCYILLLVGVFAQKNKTKIRDEDRPYEFSFTIDSEQHRYEKKDVNGIIQGEFGFITGDGVYHVTVYATDENGNFKIVSMKNIKVSEPLDQIDRTKPKQTGYQGTPPQYQQLNQYSSSNYKTTTPYQKASSTTLRYQPLFNSVTQRPYADFTSKSTIRQGCGGCGIITTPLSRLDLFSTTTTKKPFNYKENIFQTDVKKNQPPQPNALSIGGTNEITHPQSSPQSVYTTNPTITNKKNSVFKEAIKEKINEPLKIDLNGKVFENTKSTAAAPTFGTIFNKEVSQKTVFKQPSKLVSTTGLPQTTRQPLALNKTSIAADKPSIAVVENGLIKIPGNDPIRIQDKYPNMVEGLPKGITKKDISDLLYKFNYTVGFHGHYEKGWTNGTKVGGYFVNGRDGYSRVVTYVADEFGYRPKFKLIRLGLDSLATPKEDSEKSFGLQNFEFVWYPVK